MYAYSGNIGKIIAKGAEKNNVKAHGRIYFFKYFLEG